MVVTYDPLKTGNRQFVLMQRRPAVVVTTLTCSLQVRYTRATTAETIIHRASGWSQTNTHHAQDICHATYRIFQDYNNRAKSRKVAFILLYCYNSIAHPKTYTSRCYSDWLKTSLPQACDQLYIFGTGTGQHGLLIDLLICACASHNTPHAKIEDTEAIRRIRTTNKTATTVITLTFRSQKGGKCRNYSEQRL